MKALSLWQPWASLWATPDAKIHETRSWPTNYRGELAIHASKTLACPDDFSPEDCATICNVLGFPLDAVLALRAWQHLPLGAIVAVITLEDCRPTSAGTPHRLDRLFGNWTPGRFAWRRGSIIQRLAAPVPCRGFQGIWNLDPAIEASIREQLARKVTT